MKFSSACNTEARGNNRRHTHGLTESRADTRTQFSPAYGQVPYIPLASRTRLQINQIAVRSYVILLSRRHQDKGFSCPGSFCGRKQQTQEKQAAITVYTRFGGKQCPLLRSTRVSAGLRCIFITDSAQTVVGHLKSVRSPHFSRHCTVRTPCIIIIIIVDNTHQRK